MFRHGDWSPAAGGGLTIESVSGAAITPSAPRLTGDAITEERSRLRAEAKPGHRMTRLAAKTGAATIDAPAAPRTSQMLTPISAASAAMAATQRNFSEEGDRSSAATANPIARSGNP